MAGLIVNIFNDNGEIIHAVRFVSRIGQIPFPLPKYVLILYKPPEDIAFSNSQIILMLHSLHPYPDTPGGENAASRKLAQIPGIGPLTASALIIAVGDGSQFKNGRQLAAWLGLVPKQNSSGGKQTLLDISKWGDAYLRDSPDPWRTDRH